MRLLVAIVVILIGSILLGSTVDQLGEFGNGVLRLTGAAFVIGAVYCVRKNNKNSKNSKN